MDSSLQFIINLLFHLLALLPTKVVQLCLNQNPGFTSFWFYWIQCPSCDFFWTVFFKWIFYFRPNYPVVLLRLTSFKIFIGCCLSLDWVYLFLSCLNGVRFDQLVFTHLLSGPDWFSIWFLENSNRLCDWIFDNFRLHWPKFQKYKGIQVDAFLIPVRSQSNWLFIAIPILYLSTLFWEYQWRHCVSCPGPGDMSTR